MWQYHYCIVNTQEIYKKNLLKKKNENENKPIRRDSIDNLYDNNDINRCK